MNKIKLLLLALVVVALKLNAQTINKRIATNDTLSLEARVYGLSQIWHFVKTDFAYYDKLPFNWDSTYIKKLKEVHSSNDRFQYYQLLRRLVASLRDGHTNIYLPRDLRTQYLSTPPIRLKRVQGRIFIESLLNDTLIRAGLSERDEVLEINGVNVIDYGRRNIMPYVSASTQQDLLNRTYTNELLSGSKDETLFVTVKKTNAAVEKIVASRELAAQRKPFEAITFKVLPENIGLLTINTFEDASLLEKFATIMPRTTDCKGLIIDLRRNGGGNGEYSCDLLDYLFEKHYNDTQSHSRIRVSAWQTFHYPKPDNWLHQSTDSLRYEVPWKAVKYLGPLAVLISEKTFSAAEDFTAVIKQNHRGTIIGTTSGGSTGMNASYPLPGGGSFRLTIKKDTYIDGSDFVGLGILPDIEEKQSVDDFLKDRDKALQTALEYLRKK